MTQNQIEHLVARATGEDLRAVRRRGFSLANPEVVNFDPEPLLRSTHNADCDEYEFDRRDSRFRVPRLRRRRRSA